MNIFTRWVKKLWARYRYADPDKIIYPAPMGRPEDGIPEHREHFVVLAARTEDHLGAMRLHGIIRDSTGINIPDNKTHQILRDENLASEHPKKSRKRKEVRFERVTYSNSMWHTDYNLLDDGRWFLCYEDDASRFVTGYDMFEHATTTENAPAALEEAIKNHGKLASTMTDRGSQFYACASEAKRKGAPVFEKKLVELGIKQILAGLRHPDQRQAGETARQDSAQAARV